MATRLVALAALLGLAACAGRGPVAAPPAIPTAPTPAPAGAGLEFGSGRSGPEQVWHLRSALNVAALGCPQRGSKTILASYNLLLRGRKDELAAAYRGQVAVFRQRHGDSWQAPFDRYMTSLYNRLAAPGAQGAFCPVAEAIAAEAPTVASGELDAFAGRSLTRIEAAFAAPMVVETPRTTVATVTIEANIGAAALPAGGWRVQIGAYTGQAAAFAAWEKIRFRQPGLAAYAPHYEAVPARPQLVRLQIGGAGDRSSALTLCALAAAGGFDCIPLGPGA